MPLLLWNFTTRLLPLAHILPLIFPDLFSSRNTMRDSRAFLNCSWVGSLNSIGAYVFCIWIWWSSMVTASLVLFPHFLWTFFMMKNFSSEPNVHHFMHHNWHVFIKVSILRRMKGGSQEICLREVKVVVVGLRIQWWVCYKLLDVNVSACLCISMSKVSIVYNNFNSHNAKSMSKTSDLVWA